MPVVDDVPGRAAIVAEAQRLQGGVVPGGLAADVDGRLALPVGDGEVLVPVSGSWKSRKKKQLSGETHRVRGIGAI